MVVTAKALRVGNKFIFTDQINFVFSLCIRVLELSSNFFLVSSLVLLRFMNPQPAISVFREASFGHGQLEVVNATHAQWTWHRNDDDKPIASDSIWLRSLTSDPTCKL